ncbi:MAG: hypothetical protein KU28_01945 [Sulfurovum sp. PC08-66]|nr:MAG: hypothetical protein KU28_01945 [Sulfurovum sp. PC08-66]KIM12691.1 MAG: hypothetical protein KU37_02050 [Sulfuricurvum sp. PC08-66]
MRYNLDYRFELAFDHKVRAHHYALKIAPRPTPFYTIEAFQTNANFATTVDGFGNTIYFGNIMESHTHFEFLTQATIRFDRAYFEADAVWDIYRHSSPLTPMSEAFVAWLSVLKSPTQLTPLVEYLKSAIFEGFGYQAGVTSAYCSIDTLLENHQGVCQDFAHLMIAALRYYGIPARYVNGFVTGEGETHAWVEYHDGSVWLGVDPTHDILITHEPYIKLAHGRDALDTSVNKGIFVGNAQQTMHIYAHMERLDEHT